MQNSSNNIKEVFVFRSWANHCCHIFVKHHYSYKSFFLKDHMLIVFAPSALCVWNQMPWRNLQTIVLPQDFLHILLQWFNENLWSCGLISPKTILIFPKNFLDFSFETVEKQSIIYLSSYISKWYASVVLSDFKVTFLGEGDDAAFCPFCYFILFIYNVAESKT